MLLFTTKTNNIMAFKMKGPMLYKSAFNHGKHTEPSKTKYSDTPQDWKLHRHEMQGDHLAYVAVKDPDDALKGIKK